MVEGLVEGRIDAREGLAVWCFDLVELHVQHAADGYSLPSCHEEVHCQCGQWPVFELSQEEWKAAWDLCDMLKVMIIFTSSCFFLSHHHHPLLLLVLKDATLYFSCTGTPTLTTMIPAMDMIDKVFTTAAVNNTEFSAPIWSSLLVAKKTLNQYYQLTDNSDVYRIAMGEFFASPHAFTQLTALLVSPSSCAQAGLLRASNMGTSLDCWC